ncbi:hypothetical protein FB559_2070 [Actinoallomurus bryophytorum]|uniref:Uncharacterized protein n=1 Tax=Actinoallomurus bryophytorum TaxID=1490222 RepID=A0A543CHI1_9ACTN|nr:hypothetical protein FB559_2070 [Actinoallomurus bryophytorum]
MALPGVGTIRIVRPWVSSNRLDGIELGIYAG